MASGIEHDNRQRSAMQFGCPGKGSVDHPDG
jgi:hypothetical protein